MTPDDRVRFGHILDALNSAARFIDGKQRDDLDGDELLLFGLVRAIEIVGEAASRISQQTRLELPHLPWDLIIGMRNRLVHAYFDVDRDILWTTATEAAPQLAAQVARLLQTDN
jgi:uncharacterized protein with HEPN domain